ncbi:scavenger receptor 1 precursor [Cryptosporidium xiaoi]|uniref:Scavenger receptor 1 n=1 Tax=Cryptosporidium xiaoi TaxID=659607 RepID=A0AAV9XVH6_9CRYT
MQTTISKLTFIWITIVFIIHNVGCENASGEKKRVSTDFCRAVPLDGFADFAECAPPSNEAEYTIEVIPVAASGIDLKSEVDLVLYGGDESQSSPIPISTQITGTVRSMTTIQTDIGAPQQVGLFLKSNTKWKCLKITVYRDYRYWVFSCNGELSPQHRTLTFGVTGNKLYTATIMTGKSGDAGTKGGVEISISGDLAQSDKILLKQGFYSSTLRRMLFRAADVGKIKEISLTNTAIDDPWYCEFVRIQSEDGMSIDFTVRRWIGKPFSQMVTLSNNLSGSENSPAQDIDCNTRAIDIIPRAPTTTVTFKVKCPVNCGSERFTRIYGTGIHAASSSICKSAVYDNILSPTGGELVLTVVPSLPKYFGGKGAYLIESSDFFSKPGSEIFGFYTYLSDSIDFIQSEVRVVDSTGNLSSSGRLEVRRNGVWGSVALRGESTVTNDFAATLACKQLGYSFGSVLPSCNYVNGGNVCTPSGYPISVAGLQCNGNEADIAQCMFEEPITTSSITTVAVQCSSILPKDVMYGSLRIVDSYGVPSKTGSGRLEVYMDGWGSVCSDGFTSASERVACTQMGYSGVRNGGSSTKSCKDFNGEDVCGNVEQQILMVDVSCKGNEEKLVNCQHYSSTNIYCVHEEDVVVSCAGAGDPTGNGAYLIEKPPSVLPSIQYNKYKFECNDSAVSIQGAIGSGAIVSCPSRCSKASSHLKGTYVYTEDSPVCKAAIHAGVITDELGGDILVSFVPGQREYFGTLNNEIQSKGHDASGSKSKIRGSEISSRAITISKLSSSVVQADKEIIKEGLDEELPTITPPAFSWVCPNDYPGFRGGKNDFIDATNLPGGDRIGSFDDFTITARILISGGQGTWRTIMAHTECLGISLYVDRDNTIHFDQLCNSDTVGTSYAPTLNEWLFLTVAYNFNEKRVVMYINGNEVANKETGFIFNLKTKLIIGRSSDSDSEYFLGQISNVNIWDKFFTQSEVKAAMEKSWHQKGVSGGGEIKGKRHTVDGRQCITSCQSEFPVSYKMGGINYATNPTINITCDTTLDNAKFGTGSKFRVSCPSGCSKTGFPIKGHKVYTPRSSICQAAMHMGIISETGGDFIVGLYPGLKKYSGAAGKNGIVSADENKPQARSFVVGAAPKPRQLNCYDTASFIFQLPVGERELVICPGDCGLESSAKVYGMDSYSPVSSICRAAIHSSKLTGSTGGEVQIEVGPEQFHFEQSNRNGIQSESTGYYIRSFKFV